MIQREKPIMYINSAYLNDSLLNYKDTTNPLSILSCGNYKLFSIHKLPTFRPRGRLDYQLIYIASGIAHFYFKPGGTETIIQAGTFVLFRPTKLFNSSCKSVAVTFSSNLLIEADT